MDIAQIPIILAALSAFFFTFVWMGVHALGLFRLLRLEDKTMSTKAMVAWGGSFVIGFTGPCVIPLSLVTLVIGQQERTAARWGEATPATGVAAGTAVGASAVILVMAVVMAGFVLLSQAMVS